MNNNPMPEPTNPANQPDGAGIPVRDSLTETWDRASANYDAERAQDTVYQRCVAATVRAVESLKPGRVLDVGCGTGLTTLPLCAEGRTVVAVDYSAGSLRVLRQKPGSPPAFQGDICALPFRSGAFDVVLCANTLQHLSPSTQVRAVTELSRLVAPGGSLVLTVHHFSRAKRRAGWIKEGRPGQPGIDYIYRFDIQDLLRIQPDATVTAIGFSEWPLLPAGVQQWLSRGITGRLLARRGYGHMLLSVGRRRA